MEQPQNIKDIDKIIQQKEAEQKQNKPIWGYVIACVIFPLLGLFLSWRAKVLEQVLPIFLIINSVLFAYYTFSTFSASNPILLISEAFDTQETIQTPLYWLLILLSSMLVIIGFVLGIYYRVKSNNNTAAKSTLVTILFIILLAQYLLGFINTVYVSYSITQSIDQFYYQEF